jgi:hypothetical protein
LNYTRASRASRASHGASRQGQQGLSKATNFAIKRGATLSALVLVRASAQLLSGTGGLK